MDNTSNGSTEGCSPYDGPDYIGVTVTSVVVGFISFLASAFVIFLILILKKYQVLVQRLILYLALATLINSMAIMLHRVDYNGSDQNKDNFCILAGFFEQHGGWMQLNAVACITLHLFLCAVVNIRLEKLEAGYIAFIFFAPLIINWIPFIDLAYGRAGAWCWIRDSNEDCSPFVLGQVLRFVLWYVPLYVILIILIILYVLIVYKLHRTRRHWVGRYDPTTERLKEQTRTEVAPLIWYPFIYLVLNILPFINRIHNIADPDNPNLVLWYLHALSYPIVGAFIAFPFVLDSEMRKYLRPTMFKATVTELWQKKTEIQEYPLEMNENEEKPNSSIAEDSKRSSSYNSFQDEK